MSVMRDDEQNAAAKRHVKSRASQATRSEKAKYLRFSVMSSFFFFFRICKHIDSNDITQIKMHFLGREAAIESEEWTATERIVVDKTRGWRGWLQGENRLQSSGRER